MIYNDSSGGPPSGGGSSIAPPSSGGSGGYYTSSGWVSDSTPTVSSRPTLAPARKPVAASAIYNAPTPSVPQLSSKHNVPPLRLDANDAASALQGLPPGSPDATSALASLGNIPAQLYESPLSVANVLTGSRTTTTNTTLGGVRMGKSSMGLIDTISHGVSNIPILGPAIGAAGAAVTALQSVGAQDRNQRAIQSLALIQGKPDSMLLRDADPTFFRTDNPLDLFGQLRAANATVGDFRKEMTARGLTVADLGKNVADKLTAAPAAPGSLKDLPFGAVLETLPTAEDMAYRVGSDPTNLLFGAGGPLRVARGVAEGIGLADKLVAGGKILPKAVDAWTAAKAIGEGNTAAATLAGMGKFIQKGLTETVAPAIGTAWQGYKKVAATTEVGLGVANMGSQALMTNGDIARTIPALRDVHDLSQQILDNKPLSSNAAFALMSAYSLPIHEIQSVIKKPFSLGYSALKGGVGLEDHMASVLGPSGLPHGEKKTWMRNKLGGRDNVAQFGQWTIEAIAREDIMGKEGIIKKPAIGGPYASVGEMGAETVQFQQAIRNHAAEMVKDGRITPQHVTDAIQGWWGRQAGIGSEFARVKYGALRQPWDPELALDHWINNYVPTAGPIAKALMDQGQAIVGLQDTLYVHHLAESRQLFSASAVNKTVPYKSLQRILNDYPQLIINDTTGWFAQKLISKEPVPLGNLANKLNAMSKDAVPLETTTHELAAHEAAAPKIDPTPDGVMGDNAVIEPNGNGVMTPQYADNVLGQGDPNRTPLYHGTPGAPFQQFAEDTMYSRQNLYGPGVYLTDSRQIASGYAKSQRTLNGTDASGHVMTVSVPPDLNLLDLSHTVPPQVTGVLRELGTIWSRDDVDLSAAIASAERGDPGRLVYKEVKNALRDAGLTTTDAMDNLATLNEAIARLGYDGFSHTGGVGKDIQHNVTILFNPDKASITSAVHLGPTVEDAAPIRHASDTAALGPEVAAENVVRDEATTQALGDQTGLAWGSNNVIAQGKRADLAGYQEFVQSMGPGYRLVNSPVLAHFMSDAPPAIAESMMRQSALWNWLKYSGPTAPIARGIELLTARPTPGSMATQMRQAMYDSLLPHGATVQNVDDFIQALQQETKKHTVRGYGLYRNAQALVPDFIRKVAEGDLEAGFKDVTGKKPKGVFSEKTIASLKKNPQFRWDRLVDQSYNRVFQSVKKTAAERTLRSGVTEYASGEALGRNVPGLSTARTIQRVYSDKYVGSLAHLAETVYTKWQEIPATGAVRIATKTLYPLMRFMSDPRWWLMNEYEVDALGGVKYGMGSTRFGKQVPISNASIVHDPSFGYKTTKDVQKAAADRITSGEDTGQAFGSRHVATIVNRQFEENVWQSTDRVLNEIGDKNPVHQDLLNRFGPQHPITVDSTGKFPDGRTWSGGPVVTNNWAKGIYDSMYSLDGGVRTAIGTEAELAGLKAAEKQLAPLYDQLYKIHDQALKDLKDMLGGKSDRSNIERLMNHPLLYWPLSYQLKATKWLFDVMTDKSFGHQTNFGGAYTLAHLEQTHKDRMAKNPAYAKFFNDHPALWQLAQQLIPITPWDLGVSLSRPIKYAGGWLGWWTAYKTAETPQGALTAIMNVGPLYTATLLGNLYGELTGHKSQTITVSVKPKKAPQPNFR